jgi:AmpD protein
MIINSNFAARRAIAGYIWRRYKEREPALPVKIDATGNYLLDARQLMSPNCDERPPGAVIELVVVHGISLPPRVWRSLDRPVIHQSADPRTSLFCRDRPPARVQPPLIRRDGELVQYVPFHRRAPHAGQSCYRDRQACNDFSIGIELEGCG